MGELSYTVGGDSNLVSFKSAARVPITSLKAHFKPKQDLHGYSKPWPAGGGKNLIGNSFVTGKTINMAGEVITNFGGMMTSDYIEVSSMSYVWSGINKYTTANAWNYRVHGYDENKDWVEQITYQSVNKDTSYSIVFTPNDNIKYIRLSFNEQTNNNQLEKGSTATSCEPYENICPIEGWNSAKVWLFSNNLLQVTPGSASSYNMSWTVDNNGIITYEGTPTSYSSVNCGRVYLNGRTKIYGRIFGDTANIAFNTLHIYDNSEKRIGAMDVPWEGGGRTSYATADLSNYPNASYVVINTKRATNNVYTKGTSYVFITDDKQHLQIPVTFPNISKNLFEITAYTSDDWYARGYSAMHTAIDTETGIITMTGVGQGDTQLFNKKNIYYPGTYTFSFDFTYTSTNTMSKRMIITCYDANGTKYTNENLSINGFTYNQWYQGWYAEPGTFTVPDNVHHFTLAVGVGNDKSGDAITIYNVQLEYGGVATTYEPYNYNNTIYGGYLDPVAGEVVAEYILMEKQWSEWTLHSHLTSSKLDVKRTTFDKPIYIHGETKWYGKSNMTEPVWAWTEYAAPHYYYTNDNYGNNIVVYMWLPFDVDGSTVVQLAARLREPIHYPMSKTEIKTYLNLNTVWSNTGDKIQTSYALHDTAPIRAAKHRIAANEPHVETIENSLAHFETDMIAPLKKCDVYFSPKQNLNGYDEPWGGNVDNDLFDSNNIIQGYYIMGGASDANRTTGEIYVSQSNWSCTDYIQVEPNTIYTITIPGPMNATAAGMAYYESNNTASVISGISASQQHFHDYTFTTPINCNYLRFSWPSDYGNDCHLVKSSLPYKNICPITGWTGLQVHSAGKNLLRLPIMTRTNAGITWVVHEDGSIDIDGTATSQYSFMTNWNDVNQYKTFYLKAGTYKLSGGNSKIASIYLVARDGSTNKDIGAVARTSQPSTFTLSQDTLVGFQVAVAQVDGEIHMTLRPQLEWIECSDYESPRYSTMDVNWTNSAGTIYGGYIDLLTGEIWETTEIASANWGDIKTGSAVPDTGYYQGTLTFNNRIKTLHNSNLYGISTISNVFNKVMWNLGDTTPEHYYGGNDGDHGMVYLFGNYDNNTPIQIAAELETPQLVGTLSLSQLKSLKGINNIWSDANGNVEVSYWTH